MNNVEAYSQEVDAMDNILKVIEEDIPKVPEKVFVDHILPRLAEVGGNVDLTFWNKIAGNAYRPIDVVNERNETLFRVPPILRQYRAPAKMAPEDSINERLHRAKLQSQVHPQLGEVYYEHELSSLAVVPPPELAALEEWDKILIRYGYPPLNPNIAKTETVAPTEPAKSGDVEFDDL